MYFFFFFSSRRRHTRYWRDWSSDVCSSDLSSCGGDADRPEACPTEPLDGAGQRLFGRCGAEAEFARRLVVGHPHFLPGHADGIQRYARRLSGYAGPGGAARAGAIRHQIRRADLGSFSSRDAREFLQDLRQGEILRAQDVALARQAALAGLPVALRGIADVHNVEPGIDEGRHVAIQEVEHDLARRGGLDVVIAHRGGRIHNHHGQPAVGKPQGYLLGEKLGAFVISGHVLERHGRLFIADAAGRHTDAAYRAGIDDALDTCVLCSLQYIPGAIHVGAVQFAGIPGPQAVMSSHVEEQSAAGHRTFERRGVAQVSGDAFDIERIHATPGANQGAHAVPALQKYARDVPTEEPGGSGDECRLHSLLQGPGQHFEVVGQTDIDAEGRRGFVPAMHHAVVATRIVPVAVAFPGRLRHEIFEGLVVAVGDQIAGAFPALDVIGRVAPGGAGQVALALEELQVDGGLADGEALGQAIDVLEFFVDVVAGEENFAIVDRAIAVCRRDLVAVHTERFEIKEQLLDFLHVGLFIDRGVGAHLEARRLGELDALDGFLKYALALHGDIVIFLHAIEMHVEVEALVGLEFVEALLDEHAVGAEVDVAVALQNPRHQFADLRIHHRLAAANRDHRPPALIHRQQALFERHPLGDGALVLADPAAAGTGQVAGVQGLQHQHDGETLVDHGMRLALLAGFGGQDTEWVGRIRYGRDGLLPLRTGTHLVLENVPGQTGGHRDRKFHNLSIRSCTSLHERRQREQREIVLVEMVVQVENTREAGACGQFLVPTSVAALGFKQILDAVLYAEAGRVAARDQPQNGPSGLRRRAGPGGEDALVVALAAFAPSAVGVLDGAQPLAGAQDVRFAIVLPRRRESAQGEAGAVNVGHAPTAVPTAVGL